MLKHNTTLEVLYLMNNNIGNEGARRIAAALPRNSALRVLELSYNNIKFSGARRIASAVQGNTSLEVLHLECGFRIQIEKALKRNQLLSARAVEYRKVVFVWSAQVGGRIPVEVIEMVVRQTVWHDRITPRELHALLTSSERSVLMPYRGCTIG
eukprot:TRINITY_DN9301_c0_g1_i1.p2 TRINITY_DN9301_c0_g1~~TRINITY_DN9301_c0_g1_i1.p2  ORF type:complete len:154 (+),score=14.32 TRINITY_DN9301_c0_g1_i1:294-755(+)